MAKEYLTIAQKKEKCTKVKYVYTVKGRLYALETVNSIIQNNFLKDDFIIFSLDDDSAKIFDKYNLEYRKDTYGKNVYIDKFFNPMLLANADDNFVYVSFDSGNQYYSNSNRYLFETYLKEHFINNESHVLLFTYGDMISSIYKNSFLGNRINAKVMAFYSPIDITRDCLINYYETIKDYDKLSNAYIGERYEKEAKGLTEEIFLNLYVNCTQSGEYLTKYADSEFDGRPYHYMSSICGNNLMQLVNKEFSKEDFEKQYLLKIDDSIYRDLIS